jgi:tetratricopeptide (TPR) repeat protein
MRLDRKKIVVGVGILLLLVTAVGAQAQEWSGKGRLAGTIKDEQGKPVEQAKVTLKYSKGGAGPAPPLTHKKSKESVPSLVGGDWNVQIEKEGYMVSEGPARVNEYGVVPPLNVTLKVVPKEVMQESKGAKAVATIQKGNELLTAEKYAEARAEFEKALPDLDPKNQLPVLRGIARTYFQEKQSDQAIATLKRALEVAPDDPETLKLLVNLLVASGKEEEAKAYMAKMPEGVAVDPNSLLNLGIKAYNDKKLDAAADYFSRVVKENPGLADAYYYRGLVFLNQGKSAEAKADFQKVVELDPNSEKAKEAQEFIKSL